MFTFDSDKLPSMPGGSLFEVVTLPAGYITGVKTPTPMFAMPNYFVCRADLNEEVAYNVAKTIAEHSKDLANVSSSFTEIGTQERSVKKYEDHFCPVSSRSYPISKGGRLVDCRITI